MKLNLCQRLSKAAKYYLSGLSMFRGDLKNQVTFCWLHNIVLICSDFWTCSAKQNYKTMLLLRNNKKNYYLQLYPVQRVGTGEIAIIYITNRTMRRVMVIATCAKVFHLHNETNYVIYHNFSVIYSRVVTSLHKCFGEAFWKSLEANMQ